MCYGDKNYYGFWDFTAILWNNIEEKILSLGDINNIKHKL